MTDSKILNIETIPAVITNMCHDEFVEKKFTRYKKLNNNPMRPKQVLKVKGETLLSLTTIRESFAQTKPNSLKVKASINYYKEHGKFDKPIVIQGDNNLLPDGYIRFIAAQELGLESIHNQVN